MAKRGMKMGGIVDMFLWIVMVLVQLGLGFAFLGPLNAVIPAVGSLVHNIVGYVLIGGALLTVIGKFIKL